MEVEVVVVQQTDRTRSEGQAPVEVGVEKGLSGENEWSGPVVRAPLRTEEKQTGSWAAVVEGLQQDSERVRESLPEVVEEEEEAVEPPRRVRVAAAAPTISQTEIARSIEPLIHHPSASWAVAAEVVVHSSRSHSVEALPVAADLCARIDPHRPAAVVRGIATVVGRVAVMDRGVAEMREGHCNCRHETSVTEVGLVQDRVGQ